MHLRQDAATDACRDRRGENMQNRLIVTDCEHIDYLPEQEICRENGLEFVKLDLRDADDDTVVKALSGVEVVANQYLRFTDNLFDRLPDLRCIVRYGVGVDNIDIASATRHRVAVCNVPDYSVQEVAAHAFAMMLALTRKLKLIDRAMEHGIWNYELTMKIHRYSEMTVGIIGYGRIGRAFAQLAHSLGCRIAAYDILFPPTLSEKEREGYAIPEWTQLMSLEELLRTSDVISLHAPLSADNGGCVSATQLAMMKPESFLINVSRGGLVDEADLYDALSRKAIAGAAIDTWQKEPATTDNPLIGLDNVIATPHMAWYSEEASIDLKRKLAQECVRAIKGEELRCQLNRNM